MKDLPLAEYCDDYIYTLILSRIIFYIKIIVYEIILIIVILMGFSIELQSKKALMLNQN